MLALIALLFVAVAAVAGAVEYWLADGVDVVRVSRMRHRGSGDRSGRRIPAARRDDATCRERSGRHLFDRTLADVPAPDAAAGRVRRAGRRALRRHTGRHR